MSAFKKSLLVAGVAMILSNNVFADEGHGIVKFKGEVISAPCSIKPGDEDLTGTLPALCRRSPPPRQDRG